MLNVKKTLTKIMSYIYGDSSRTELVSGVYYRKRSGIVQVEIYNNFTLSSSWTTIGTLPVGYRPPSGFYFAATTVGNNANIIGSINDIGSIQLRLPSGSGQSAYSVEGIVTFMGGGN